MKKRVLKTIAYIMIASFVLGTLSGCGASVDLTEEQTELIAEYSAGLLLRYSKGNSIGLKKLKDVDFKELDVVPTPTPEPTNEPEPEEVQEEEAVVGNVAGDDSAAEDREVILPPLAECFGLEGCDLSFSYAELCYTYPETDNLVFAMNASEDNQLLIMHFNLTNISSEALALLANLGGGKMRAIVNDGEKIRAELTFLTNDLMSYAGNLEPAQSEDVVLVFEVPDGTEIDSLALLVVKGAEQYKYNF